MAQLEAAKRRAREGEARLELEVAKHEQTLAEVSEGGGLWNRLAPCWLSASPFFHSLRRGQGQGAGRR